MSDLDWLSKIKWPEEYPKPRYVVADNMVEAFREHFGDRAEIIPVSETRLPVPGKLPP